MCGARTRRFSGKAPLPMCGDAERRLNPPEVTVCQKGNLGKVHELLMGASEAAAWSLDALAETFERYPSYFLVCWQREELAGFISGRRAADEGEILNLAV